MNPAKLLIKNTLQMRNWKNFAHFYCNEGDEVDPEQDDHGIRTEQPKNVVYEKQRKLMYKEAFAES